VRGAELRDRGTAELRNCFDTNNNEQNEHKRKKDKENDRGKKPKN